MNGISFGQYYPADSPIHHLDARIKIILSVVFIAAVFFVKSYFGYLVTLLFLASVIGMSRVPLSVVFKTVKAVLFLIIFTFVLNLFLIDEGRILWSLWIFDITDQAVHYAIMMALRLFLLITGTTLLTLTTTPMDLTDGIESLMSPLKIIKFPVHDVALIMSIALRFIPTLIEETNKIMNAQKARGASFDHGGLFKRAKALLPVLIPLFVSSIRRADELALAMDARCYNASPNRTRRKVLKIGGRDIAALFIAAAYFTLILLDRYFFLSAVDRLFFGLF
jgi:energy-coupling factor transport system permease protein